jgi:SAM-dependent methyltransferase
VAVQDGFRIVRCGRCELVFVDTWHEMPPPEDLYGPGYFRTEGVSPLGYHDYLAHERLHLRNARSILRVLEGVPAGRRLVDVGCAHGFLLVAARERGWTGCGVDISREAVRYAREKLGLDVRHGDLAHAGFPEAAFDAVAMVGTIEHMPDPLTVLRSAARLLKPGGHVLITTLDIEGAFRQWEWKAPEHIFYFSFRSLSRLLEAAGFQVLRRQLRHGTTWHLVVRLPGMFPGAGPVRRRWSERARSVSPSGSRRTRPSCSRGNGEARPVGAVALGPRRLTHDRRDRCRRRDPSPLSRRSYPVRPARGGLQLPRSRPADRGIPFPPRGHSHRHPRDPPAPCLSCSRSA